MDEAKEALGRLVIARFEQRRALEAARARAARWRFVALVCQLVFLAAVWVYFASAKPGGWTEKVSWRELLPLLLVVVGAGVIREYQIREELQKLRWEVDRLRQPKTPESEIENLPER